MFSVSDLSVLRRILFAVTQLPSDCPQFWEIAVDFGTSQRRNRNPITPTQARILFENIQELNSEAFATDQTLIQELIKHPVLSPTQPLGQVLISQKSECSICRGSLSIRMDRPSTVTIYDDQLGTIPGTHYQKYCRRPKCRLHQYYGYYTVGDNGELLYDNDWSSLPYFGSTQKTAFSMTLLRNYDAQLLIGQVSYKQQATIYNYIHGYMSSQEESNDSNLTVKTQWTKDSRYQLTNVIIPHSENINF